MCKPKALGGMGFKDLEKFNEAMLAKQLWRLLTDHTSLFYKVFRAKYFLSGSVWMPNLLKVFCLAKHCKSKESYPIGFVVEGRRWKSNKNF